VKSRGGALLLIPHPIALNFIFEQGQGSARLLAQLPDRLRAWVIVDVETTAPGTYDEWLRPRYDRKRRSDPGFEVRRLAAANHLALLEKNLPLIQFVTNLSQIGNNRFTVVAVPLAIKGADASPVRVIALVE
jgi:kynurenine formamidase